jgi:drug/metabolite transporter (DMT)-like permease
MNQRTKAHIAVLAANIIYAINFSVMKTVTSTIMQPIALNVLRITGATFLFWAMWLSNPQKVVVNKKHYLRFFICALAGIVINQLFFVKGVSLTTSVSASLLMLITPIAVVFIAAYILKEKITYTKILGLLVGVAGAIVLITMRETTKAGENHLLGDTFIIINAVSYAFYLVLVKPLMQHYNAIMVIRWLFTIALFIVLPIGYSEVAKIEWQQLTAQNYVAIIFIVIGVTFCAYLFNIYGVQVLGSTITGAYIYSQPLFVAAIALLLQNDMQQIPLKLIAAVFIFIGVYLVSYKNESAKQQVQLK